MNGDYKDLLRTIYGEPTVDDNLLGTVTSVCEGDEDAYAAALVAIGRTYGYYCVETAIEDERAPGVVLDAILGGKPRRERRYCETFAEVEVLSCYWRSPGERGAQRGRVAAR